MKVFCILFSFFSILPGSYGQQNIPWQTSTPEEQGMSSLRLLDEIKKLRKDSTKIHSLLVIRNNHIVLDASFYPFQKDFAHDIASVTKSITSLLIGIAIDKGFIKNDDEPVVKYFPEYPIKNDTLKKIRLKDLLNMATGLQCSWNDGEKELEQMQDSPDWVAFMLNLPFSSQVGEKFSYCSGNYFLLAEILQRTTKMKCHEFARKYLFDPLQFRKSYWEENSKGINHGWGDLHINPYDLAKIGCLLLSDGKWNGKMLVSNEWLKKIKPLYYIHGTESYGFGWWLENENPAEIQALGRGGQRLFVLKDENVVIVTTGGGFNAGDIDDFVQESIESYNKNENHSSDLKNLIKSIQNPDTKSIRTNNFSSGMLGKSFVLEKNDVELTSIGFEKRNKDYYLIIQFEDSSREKHAIGIDNQYRISKEHLFGLPVAIKSFWDNNKLIVDYNGLSRINFYRFTITFYGDSIDFDYQDFTNKQHVTLKGNSKKS
jgi:CubicO group peptidase (beta-lactamase class C family)